MKLSSEGSTAPDATAIATSDWAIAFLPVLALGAAIVLTMLAIAFSRHRYLAPSCSILGLLITLATLPIALSAGPQVTTLARIDAMGLLFIGLLSFASLCVVLFSITYFDKHAIVRDEYYLLVLLGTFGSLVLVISNHFATMFLGLEILSAALFALISYLKAAPRALEAGVKYLILAGSASALLLMGIALVYSGTGALGFASLNAYAAEQPLSAISWSGLSLVLVGISFKLALVPFHMWTPDVYQGAPAPVTAFIATVSKGGILYVLMFRLAPLFQEPPLFTIVAAVAGASMIIGNVLALLQPNLKRLLAYSSIAHFGYLLVGVLSLDAQGGEATSFYLIAYILSTLVAFGVISMLSDGDEPESIEHVRALCWQRPAMGAALVISLLSLLGLPLTGGFLGKTHVLTSAAGSAHWFLAAALVLGSGIGIYYYLRVILITLTDSPSGQPPLLRPPRATSALLAVLTAGILLLGVYPKPVHDALEAAHQPADDALAQPERLAAGATPASHR